MSAKSLFGVVVRTLGLWLALRGLGGLLVSLVNAATIDAGLLPGLRGGWLINALWLLAGICLLRAAPVLVRFAYAGDDDRG